MASTKAIIAFVSLHLLCVHHYYSLALMSSPILFYADNKLDQTIAYKYLPSRERKEMQQEILSLLGLHHRPKPKTHRTDNSAPKYLIDLYKSFLDEESGNLKINEALGPVVIEGEVLSNNSLHAINDSDIIMSFVNQIHHKAPHLRHDKDRRFWFDVSEVSPEENIMDAELRLFRDLSHNTLPSNLTYQLTLYSLSQGDDPEDKVLNYVDSANISNEEGWIMFNVTDPMITWVTFPHHNLGLYLRIRANQIDRDIDPHEIGIIGTKGSKDRQPFMTAFFKSKSYGHVRRTRATRKRQRSDVSFYDHDEWNPYLNPNDRYASGRSCQKRTLYVSFRDLGWQDWIIAPDGYAAFFCDGECSFPLNAHMNATNHAIVQTLVHLMNPYNVPKPCCAPTKLSAIMVLYFDDNSNVILKKYKNMVVKSCGCH